MSNWHTYPMGPALRTYLNISSSDYRGDESQKPSEDLSSDFQLWLLNYIEQTEPHSVSEEIDLLEELTTMGMSQASIKMFESYPFDHSHDDFRTLLAVGSAYMMESSHETAIRYLGLAQEIEPGEISPYVNIALIYYSLSEDNDAIVWATAGLKVEPNHQKLWELIASVYISSDRQTAGESVEQIAREHNSYAGFSLAAELMNPGDALLKAQLLEAPFEAGVRDTDYLVEYTAALGLAQQFDKIPSILWQLERVEGKKADWKLLAHVAQAFFALDQEKEAKEIIAQLEKNPETPQSIVTDLKQTYDQQFVI